MSKTEKKEDSQIRNKTEDNKSVDRQDLGATRK